MAVADVNVGAGSSSVKGASASEYYPESATSGWTGYIGFAALMLIVVGCFHAVAGFVAIFKDSYYTVPSKELLVTVDYTAWGWAHLIFGLVALLVAVGMFAGAMWARVIAVIFAVVSALLNLSFLDAKPIWATMIIAFDVVLIWALTVHGGDAQQQT